MSRPDRRREPLVRSKSCAGLREADKEDFASVFRVRVVTLLYEQRPESRMARQRAQYSCLWVSKALGKSIFFAKSERPRISLTEFLGNFPEIFINNRLLFFH